MRGNKSSTQAVRLRQRSLCTGETVNQAMKQLASDGGPLMPVAAGGQPDLEAALLLSLNRAARRARAAHRGTELGGPLVRRVRLLTRALWLEVAEDAVGRLLAASLPSVGAEGLEGIAGLRPDPGRDHLDLRLMGADGSARGVVRLVGVTRDRWRDAIRQVDGSQAIGEPVWLDHRDALHEAEMAALVENTAVIPTDLMSAVIHRYPLWRRAAWVDSMVEGDSLRVRWQSGPRDAVVAAILADSACRIPGVTVAKEPLAEAMQSIILSYTKVTATIASDTSWAWAEFRAAGITLPEAADPTSEPSEPTYRPQPSPVTPDVWDQREMRDALARREISAVYRLLRRHGVSQRQIAALTGQSQSEVAEIFKGRQVIAHDVLARIAASLGVPRGYMGLAYDEANAVRAAAEGLTHEERIARRRFLAHAAAIEAGLQATSGRPVKSAQPSRRDPVELPNIHEVETAARALQSSAEQRTNGRTRLLARAHLWVANQLRNTTEGESGRDRLERAIEDLKRIAGSTNDSPPQR